MESFGEDPPEEFDVSFEPEEPADYSHGSGDSDGSQLFGDTDQADDGSAFLLNESLAEDVHGRDFFPADELWEPGDHDDLNVWLGDDNHYEVDHLSMDDEFSVEIKENLARPLVDSDVGDLSAKALQRAVAEE